MKGKLVFGIELDMSPVIEFKEGAHAIVCFNTVDKGLIFVEPQDDNIVILTIGKPYFGRSRYTVDFDDTVMRYGIIY